MGSTVYTDGLKSFTGLDAVDFPYKGPPSVGSVTPQSDIDTRNRALPRLRYSKHLLYLDNSSDQTNAILFQNLIPQQPDRDPVRRQ